jgi:hypothetical protein
LSGDGKLGAGEIDTGDRRLTVEEIGDARVDAVSGGWESGRCGWKSS